METKKQMVYPKIEQTIYSLNINSIPAERKELLQGLIDYLKTKVENKEPINLNFICTHNSRRSHLSQIWAQVITSYLNIKNVTCYSGGTEATAMFPKVAETLSNQGFQILKLSETENPVYAVKFSDTIHPVICFSKTYDATFNPKFGFGAILTCDSANEACPMVNGAESRFPITYKDPKAFDGTPLQDEKYHERSVQIASELLYVFKTLKKFN